MPRHQFASEGRVCETLFHRGAATLQIQLTYQPVASERDSLSVWSLPPFRLCAPASPLPERIDADPALSRFMQLNLQAITSVLPSRKWIEQTYLPFYSLRIPHHYPSDPS